MAIESTLFGLIREKLGVKDSVSDEQLGEVLKETIITTFTSTPEKERGSILSGFSLTKKGGKKFSTIRGMGDQSVAELAAKTVMFETLTK